MTGIRNTVIVGDALASLTRLPSESVDCVITSPPYYRLRDYHVAGQLGQEARVQGWVAGLRDVLREVHRVLAPHGSLWLNLGDSYSSDVQLGAAAKSLLLAPERLLLALAEDGWLIRNKVIWDNPNPLPSPARDRLTSAHQVIYFLVKQPRYFFDLDPIRQPLVSRGKPSRGIGTPDAALGSLAGARRGLRSMARAGLHGHALGKNPGDVWRIASARLRGAHFATFPREIVRRPLLATCPPKVCTRCRRPWHRSTARVELRDGIAQSRPLVPCGCGVAARPGLVLDPFFGTGTVAEVARAHDRDWLGIELNPAYLTIADARLGYELRRAP